MSEMLSTPFKMESYTAGGGTPIEASYFYDPNTDEWVSFHTDTIEFGFNTIDVLDGNFIKYVNGTIPTSSHGPIIPHDFKVISISAMSDNPGFPNTVVLRLHNNGAQIGSDISWHGSNQLMKTLDINGDAGNLSCQMASSLADPHHPTIHLEVRWRI